MSTAVNELRWMVVDDEEYGINLLCVRCIGRNRGWHEWEPVIQGAVMKLSCKTNGDSRWHASAFWALWVFAIQSAENRMRTIFMPNSQRFEKRKVYERRVEWARDQLEALIPEPDED